MDDFKKISEWEVLTPTGWSDFGGIKKTEKDFYYKILFSNGYVLGCSDKHKIKMSDNQMHYIFQLKVGDITSENLEVKNIEIVDDNVNLYDLISVEKNNEYYIGDDIVSSNCAFIERVDDLWTASYPTISNGGRAILLSTPNGTSNLFYDIWTAAENGDNEFTPTKIYWWQVPNRDEKWKQKALASLRYDQKKFDQEYACVHPDTNILTKNGVKLIKDIKIGDYVLTHNGRFRQVNDVMVRDVRVDENIYNIKRINYNTQSNLIISGDHPIRICKIKGMTNFQQKIQNKEYIKSFENLDSLLSSDNSLWVSNLFPKLDVNEIFNSEITHIDLNANGEFIEKSGKLTYYRCNSFNKIDRHIKLDYDLGFVIGLYAAEGSQSYDGKIVDFGAHANEYDLYEKILEYFKKIGYSKSVDFKVMSENRARYTFRNKVLSKLINTFVHDDIKYLKNKKGMKWFNDIIYKTPPEFIKGIIIGHYLGDGLHNVGYKISSASVSENLIYQLRLMYNFFNFYPAINKSNSRSCNLLELSNANMNIFDLFDIKHDDILKDKSRIHYIDGEVYSFIHNKYTSNNIEVINYTGKLYNLSVCDDESYVANNIVVHNCNFESSSQSVISLSKINAIIRRNEQNKIKPIKEFHTKTNQKYAELSTYERPKENARYLFAIDTAEGLGEERDASAFLGFNLMDNSIMLEYTNKELNEKQFAKVVKDIAETYNNAFLVIELKSTGKLVANYLLEWGYKNIIWIDSRMSLFLDPKTDRFVPTGNEYNKNNNIIPGFRTNTANKVVIVNEMKNAVENDEIIDIYTSKMLEQQKAFVNKGGVSMPKYAAFGRNNDDLVMCMAIGVFIKKYIWSIIENNAIFNDEVLKYFMRRTETMADSEILSEAASFSPIYNMKNFRKRINPYKSPFAEQFGDTRYLLNNYNPNKNK